jgi:hypothetical protein
MKDIQNEFVLSVPAGCIEQQSNAENRTWDCCIIYSKKIQLHHVDTICVSKGVDMYFCLGKTKSNNTGHDWK